MKSVRLGKFGPYKLRKQQRRYDYRCAECGELHTYNVLPESLTPRCHPERPLLPWSDQQEAAYQVVLTASKNRGLDLDEWVITVEVGRLLARPYFLDQFAAKREPNRLQLLNALRWARRWQHAEFYEGRVYEAPKPWGNDPFARIAGGPGHYGFKAKLGRHE